MSTEATLTIDAAAEQLPDDLVVLKGMVLQLLQLLKLEQRTREAVEHRLDLLLRRLYGKRSEKLDPRQLLLFALDANAADEPPAPAAPDEPKPAAATTTTKKKNGHGRRSLERDFAHLPRIVETIDLPEAARACPCCGESRAVIGNEATEKLDYRPASFFVHRLVRIKYACTACEGEVKLPPLPPQPIDKGMPGAGLIAHVLVGKYVDHLPLYRQEAICEREGVPISRKTLCDWVAAGAAALAPIVAVMRQQILLSRVIHTDDTSVPVLDPTLNQTRTGRLWTYLGDQDHAYTVYDFTPTRQRDGPDRFLAGFTGYLQADAYGGYDTMFTMKGMTEVACMAHARRKFFDARTTDPARSALALGLIRELYAVESDAKERLADVETIADLTDHRDLGDVSTLAAFKEGALHDDVRLRLRTARARPVLERMKRWLDEQAPLALPKSPIGEAISYARSHWEALCRYTEAGCLAIGNNAAERAMKFVVIGRKNWMFAGSDNGGERAAIIYSITATCKRHAINPFEYLRDVLERLPTHPKDKLADLLPDRWQAARTAAHANAASSPVH